MIVFFVIEDKKKFICCIFCCYGWCFYYVFVKFENECVVLWGGYLKKKLFKFESGVKGDLIYVYNRVKLNKDYFINFFM